MWYAQRCTCDSFCLRIRPVDPNVVCLSIRSSHMLTGWPDDLMTWWPLAQHKWPRSVPKLKHCWLPLYHPASLQTQIQIHIMSLHIVFPPAPLLQWWPIPGAGSPPNISAAVKHQIGTIWPENRKQDQEISSSESLMPESLWKISPIWFCRRMM